MKFNSPWVDARATAVSIDIHVTLLWNSVSVLIQVGLKTRHMRGTIGVATPVHPLSD